MSLAVITYRQAKSGDMPSIISLVRRFKGDDRILDARQFIVACDKNDIVGCIRTVQVESDCKELSSLIVLPAYRKKGIGTTLVKKILEKDTSRPLYLITYTPRVNFYRKHNFFLSDPSIIPKTLQRDFKHMTDVDGLDLVVMELR